MVRASDAAGTRFVIGIGVLAGAALLVWLASTATLRLDRSEMGGVTCSLEVRALGRVPISRTELRGVLTASLVRTREPGSQSDTPDRLVFVSGSGPADLGLFSQRFTRDFPSIKAFLENTSERELSLSSVARREEKVRFVGAHVAASFLVLCGVFFLRSGGRALLRGG